MMKQIDAEFWPDLRTRGLCGVSAFMAAFCGLATVIVAAFTIILFLGVGAAMVTASKTGETAWRYGSINLEAKSQRHDVRPCQPARQADCPSPAKSANLPPREIATISLALLVGTMPLGALTYGLLEASRCFAAMARGRFLARETAARLTRFAVGGLIFVVLFPHAGAMATAVEQGAASVLDLLAQAPQPIARSSHFNFTVSGVSEWLNAIYAVTLTVIAVVMARASLIAEDHAQIV
ncbi:hypothetical protein BH10PSE3_BH10PSE3_39620 [soil metagenome]